MREECHLAWQASSKGNKDSPKIGQSVSLILVLLFSWGWVPPFPLAGEEAPLRPVPAPARIYLAPWDFPSVCVPRSAGTSLTCHHFSWLAFTWYQVLDALLCSAGLVGGLKVV